MHDSGSKELKSKEASHVALPKCGICSYNLVNIMLKSNTAVIHLLLSSARLSSHSDYIYHAPIRDVFEQTIRYDLSFVHE